MLFLLAARSLLPLTTQAPTQEARRITLPVIRARPMAAPRGPMAARCPPARPATWAIQFWRATVPPAASILPRCSSPARVLTFLSPPTTARRGLRQSKARPAKQAVISPRTKNGLRSITSGGAAMAMFTSSSAISAVVTASISFGQPTAARPSVQAAERSSRLAPFSTCKAHLSQSARIIRCTPIGTTTEGSLRYESQPTRV